MRMARALHVYGMYTHRWDQLAWLTRHTQPMWAARSNMHPVHVCACASSRVWHGCYNFHSPQDLDDVFLVVWDGYAASEGPPWRSLSEPELREFLIDRARDGYAFPLNPVWPVRDPGWYDVLKALKQSPDGARNLATWYPPDVLSRIDALHAAHPRAAACPAHDHLLAFAPMGTAAMRESSATSPLRTVLVRNVDACSAFWLISPGAVNLNAIAPAHASSSGGDERSQNWMCLIGKKSVRYSSDETG